MIEAYINSALENARYKIISDKETYYGEVKGLPGVWATGKTLEECRRRLSEVIEGWILVRVRKGLSIPAINGHRINQPKKILVHV